MADAAVGFLLRNLQELILAEAELQFGAKDELEWIKTEFQVMLSYLESIDARRDQLSEHANKWHVETRTMVSIAEGVIETYAKMVSKMRESSILLRPIYSAELRSLDLRKIRIQIDRVKQGWRGIDLLDHASSSSSSGGSGFAAATTAMKKLETTLMKYQYKYRKKYLYKGIKWVRDELVSLHHFLQQVDDHVLQSGERQKLWIQELRDIFQYIVEDDVNPDRDEIKLQLVISVIQDKILQLYRRYFTYGIGEILVDNGRRSVFPKIRLTTPVPDVSSSIHPMDLVEICKLPLKPKRILTITYSSWLTPKIEIESLRVDLKLIKALLKDISSLMRDLEDETVVKVWLNQMQEIRADLEKLDEASNTSQGRRQAHEMARKLRHIGHEIRDIAARKLTYGIGSALGEPGGVLDATAALSFDNRLSTHSKYQLPTAKAISKAWLDRRVKSAERELQLMQALIKDVNRMERLGARQKLWLREMKEVTSDANEVSGLDFNTLHGRNQAITRIRQIYHRIGIITIQKHTYDIADVKPRRDAGIFNHNLEEIGPYPPNGPELTRRQMMYIQALDRDIAGINELDGTSDAWMDEMRNIASSFTRYSIDLDQVENKIRQLSEIRIAYGIEPRNRLPPNIVPELKANLLKDDYDQACIIPILGITNGHKEALRELINYDNAIRRHFDWHAWVSVPKDLPATSISDYIEEQIMEQEENLRMLQVPPNKRYLILLDEIQTIEVWHCDERVHRQISTGSRIILISNEHTFSLLNSESDTRFGSPINLKEPPNTNISYHLRQCIYYFLLFPANYEVPSRRLIYLWVAEGVFRSSKENENESAEHVAEKYLNQLVALDIIRVTKKKPNGKVKTCRLSDGTREVWFMKAKESRFFQDTSDNITRLVDHHGFSGPCFIQIHGNPNSSSSVQNYRRVVSFLSFDTREGRKPGEDIGNFVRDCIAAKCFLGLRVLDLEGVFRPKLPKGLSQLTHLRYLGLRLTYLESLPPFVSQLLNLLVLDVKHTSISVLPKSIWSMQYLRHLYLSEVHRTRFTGRPSSISLSELQTLWGAFIDGDTWVTGGLDTLRNIRKLGLSCRSVTSEKLQAVNEWISNLRFLEILRLKSRDEDGRADELHLSPLMEKPNLSTVYLLGKLDPIVVHKFPDSLTDITLSGSELAVDPMEYLEKLPNLLTLRLLSQSVVCRKMHCSRNGFRALKFLDVWKLENLEEWEVEEGSMPYLENLEIRCCVNLKTLPDALRRVDTLKKLKLTGMPEAFRNKTMPELWAKCLVE